MAHSLILGQTESGKTCLGKQLAGAHLQAGKLVLVLDPMNDPGWPATYKTTDPQVFLEYVWANQSAHVFIDESGKMVGRYDDEMERTATEGRHFGHSLYYLSQRGAQLNTTVRSQCRHLFLFQMHLDDCKQLAKDFNSPELLKASTLPQFEFFHAQRFKPVERGRVTIGE